MLHRFFLLLIVLISLDLNAAQVQVNKHRITIDEVVEKCPADVYCTPEFKDAVKQYIVQNEDLNAIILISSRTLLEIIAEKSAWEERLDWQHTVNYFEKDFKKGNDWSNLACLLLLKGAHTTPLFYKDLHDDRCMKQALKHARTKNTDYNRLMGYRVITILRTFGVIDDLSQLVRGYLLKPVPNEGPQIEIVE
jgi:hypothetical protein